MRVLSLFAFLAVICLLIEAVPAPVSHQKVHARRHLRRSDGSRNRVRVHKSRGSRLPRYPYLSPPTRDEERPESCTYNEIHLLCGQEQHCDLTCDNMYSPPHCLHNTNIPKCYFPRCQCKPGYVRSHEGKCIPPSECPNRYMEPNEEESNDIMVVFKPMLPKAGGKIHSFRSRGRKARKERTLPQL